MKLICLILVFVFVFSSFVIAGGLGDDGASILNLDSSLRAVTDTGSTNLRTTSVASASERVIFYKTVDSVEYILGETTISFRDDRGRVSDADLTNLATDYDVTNNKAVLGDDDVDRASGFVTLYIPKKNAQNGIVICEGATSVSQVFRGCAADSSITKEAFVFPPNCSPYVCSEYSESGVDYWKVEELTGTGVQTINVNLGGSGPENFLKKGETIYLNEGTLNYIVNINSEYYVSINGKGYKFLLDYVDPENRFASLYVESLNETFIVYKNDVEEFDLDLDGVPDVIFEVSSLNFPFVTSKLTKYYVENIEFLSFDVKEKEPSQSQRSTYESSGGIWSNFIKDTGLTKSKFYSIVILSIMFVVVVIIFGKQIISMIWKAQ